MYSIVSVLVAQHIVWVYRIETYCIPLLLPPSSPPSHYVLVHQPATVAYIDSYVEMCIDFSGRLAVYHSVPESWTPPPPPPRDLFVIEC